jgi:hypothetical protein
MGIWQGVSLSAVGPVALSDPVVTSDLPLPRTDVADLTVQTTLTNATAKPQSGVLTGTAEGGIAFKTPVTLAAGEARVVTVTPATAPAMRVRRPRLWWPNGYGPQNLYTMRLAFTQGGVESDAGRVTFGIRKIAYAVPGSDNLTLSVNGVPVVAKGGDWGMDEAMKRIPRSRLEAQIRLHKLANYTLIRNWVGQSTSEAFYDMCDKYGILVWDEFFQPNPYDGPNPVDDGLYLANVREKILRFRSHPCIALWCARNEGNPPPEIDKGIQTLTAELDPGRLYQRSSTEGRGVRSSGPYYWRAPREFYNVDAPFKTEIGSVSIPTLEAVRAMMPRKDWETVNDDWAEHDLAAGAQRGDTYPVVLGARYGRETSLADFVRKGQLANYEAFRAMYEGRFAQLFHPVTGVITWMSNPAQPSFVWQLYSYDLEPNASLFAVWKACEPVHVMMNQENWHLMVVNNTPRPLTGLTARVAVYDMDGSLRYEHADPVSVDPDSTGDFGEIAFPAGLSPVHFVKLELRDSHNGLVSDNFYWRADPAHPDDFTALSALPTVALDVKAARRASAADCVIDVTLLNPTRSVALMAHLQLRRAKSGLRVLPVYHSDNYVSLLPGESKTVTVEAAEADLDGEAPLLAVDGWNVTVNPAARGAVRVAANAEAFVKSAPALPMTEQAGGPARIDCGGGGDAPFTFGTASADGFSADRDERGGNTKTVSDTIDVRTAHAAPMIIYQSERWGPSTYTIPVEKGKTYTVRLHFAETTFDQAGARRFHVAIDGKRVLTDFDVFAEAGGKFRAVVKDFPGIAPDAEGRIVIDFIAGSADQPKIDGIEVLPE